MTDRPILAIGCASTAGMAAALALYDFPPNEKLQHALRIAADIDLHVGPPYDIINDRPE